MSADGQDQRVAGVVLAYRPEPSIVDNVRALLRQVARVYVVDNSPEGPGEKTDADAERIIATLRAEERVSILPQGGNVGVAAGFNSGMRAALDAGFDFVWIFDQDSTVTDGSLARLLAARAAAGVRVGIVAPALRSHATGIVYAREQGEGPREVDVLISSGSLFSRGLVDTVGLHDEPLFIDYVDHEISLRARKYGFRNLKVHDTLLDHRFGDSDPIRVFGRRAYLANYSPVRHFHAARNRIIIIRRYGFGRWFWEDLWFTAKAWTKLLLAEPAKWSKITAAARGVGAGLRYPARELHF
ncbi:glycosyltransferase [Microbacterium sp. 2C]|uniref:glycosyltransferase n=1 Tax=Microbacterium paulum TaxID=2707006 RepID=UPI0018C29B99|nr:glycosyltransferase [Microbacterium paulum]MBG0717957.1 glycosyltransferase [Microbacterium paulum]